MPDEKIGWVLLNANGGHPGNDQQHSAIRRWTAPRDGKVTVAGKLEHKSDKGDGVRGRIVSGRNGVLREWIAQNGDEETKLENIEIERGETVDFVVDCRGGPDSDSFTWAPVIRFSSPTADAYAGSRIWNAKEDFSGPKDIPKPLDAWEKFAQVLLLSNELAFVD